MELLAIFSHYHIDIYEEECQLPRELCPKTITEFGHPVSRLLPLETGQEIRVAEQLLRCTILPGISREDFQTIFPARSDSLPGG